MQFYPVRILPPKASMYYSSSYTEIGATSRPDSWRVPKLALRCLSIVICWAVIAVEVSNIIEYEKLYHEIADIVFFVTPPVSSSPCGGPGCAAVVWLRQKNGRRY